jgi:methionyl-tRNA formyltransferase
VKKLALEHNIAVFQPLNFKQEGSVEELEALNADIMIVVAYGLLLPLAVLEAPKMGCLNVHASILPRWRGAAPIQRAIQVGDTETGITIMQMDVGLDTGDMLSKTLLDIKADETGGSLHDRLLEKGPTALLQTLTLLQAGEAIAEKQDDTLANYAHKLTKEEALINWSLPAKDIDLNIRAFNPFPCAYTLLGDQRIKVWQAVALEEATTLLPGTIARVSTDGVDVATNNGLIRLLNIQLIGKKAMAIRDFINGQPNVFQPQHMFASQA